MDAPAGQGRLPGQPSRSAEKRADGPRPRRALHAVRRHLFAVVLGVSLLVCGAAVASVAAGQLSSLNPLVLFREARPRIAGVIRMMMRLMPGSLNETIGR